MKAFGLVTRVLRSRRLAIRLIVAVSVWATLAGSVPGWSRSFTSWPFLTIASLLCAATAACAYERSVGARRWRRLLLAEQPTIHNVPLAAAADALKASGLVVREEAGAFVARRRGISVSLWASPVLHWALAVGLALALFGSVTSSNAAIVLVSGEPLHVDVGGVAATLELLDARPNLIVDGIARGDSPRVSVRAGDERTRQAWVYPNQPMRVGGLTLHAIDTGPDVRLALRGPDGSVVETDVPLVRGEGDSGSFGARLGVGDRTRVVISQGPGRSVRVRVADDSAEGMRAAVVRVGESVDLAGGLSIRVLATSTWATLVAVNDPTLPWLAAVALLACSSAGLALLYPARVVYAEAAGNGCEVRILSSRSDSSFRNRVKRALQERSEVG